MAAKITPETRRCQSCGGVYRSMMADGTLYFHVCPLQIVDTPEVVDDTTKEIITPATFKAVTHPRDENVQRVKPIHHTGDAPPPVPIKSEGLGYVVVPDVAAAPPR